MSTSCTTLVMNQTRHALAGVPWSRLEHDDAGPSRGCKTSDHITASVRAWELKAAAAGHRTPVTPAAGQTRTRRQRRASGSCRASAAPARSPASEPPCAWSQTTTRSKAAKHKHSKVISNWTTQGSRSGADALEPVAAHGHPHRLHCDHRPRGRVPRRDVPAATQTQLQESKQLASAQGCSLGETAHLSADDSGERLPCSGVVVGGRRGAHRAVEPGNVDLEKPTLNTLRTANAGQKRSVEQMALPPGDRPRQGARTCLQTHMTLISISTQQTEAGTQADLRALAAARRRRNRARRCGQTRAWPSSSGMLPPSPQPHAACERPLRQQHRVSGPVSWHRAQTWLKVNRNCCRM